MKTPLKAMIITLLAALLAACGGSPAATTPPQATGEPVEATTAPTSPTLSETYTSDDGKWTFQYPAGWVINDSIANIILIATSQATADKAYTLAGYDADEASIMFGLNTINDSNNKPADHVTTFAGGIGIPLGEAAETTVSGRNGARVDGSSDVRHLMVISQVFGDTYVDAVTYTHPDEFTQMEPTLLAIIESVNYSAE